MIAKELIEIILEECEGDLRKEVKLDGPIPVPLENAFNIESGKGWVLFKDKRS
jgi:hypothetical protein